MHQSSLWLCSAAALAHAHQKTTPPFDTIELGISKFDPKKKQIIHSYVNLFRSEEYVYQKVKTSSSESAMCPNEEFILQMSFDYGEIVDGRRDVIIGVYINGRLYNNRLLSRLAFCFYIKTTILSLSKSETSTK